MNDSITNSAGWFKLTPDQQKAMLTIAFKEKYANGSNTQYNKADATRRGNMEKAFTMVAQEDAYNSEHNPDVIAAKAAQNDTDNSNAIYNWGRQIVDSHTDLAGRLNLFQQAMSDDPNTASTAEKYYSKRRTQAQTEDSKALAADLKVGFDTWKNEGFVNKIKAFGQIAGVAISNPVGVIDSAAQSMSSMTSMGLGALGGGAVGNGIGTVVPGIGNVAGALWGSRAGALGAETVDAASAKFTEILDERLKELNLNPTQSNIASVMSDKEWVGNAKKKSMVYGGSLSLADQLTAGLVTKFAELPGRAAKNAVRASITDADKIALAAKARLSGKTIEAETEDAINRIVAIKMAARSVPKKAVTAAINYSGEVASEPVSEAIGTATSGDENTIENLTMETLGGTGTGPLGVAINKSLYGTKIAADKSKELINNIMNSTPESKATSVAQSDAIKTAKAQAQSQANFGFDDAIKTADPTNSEHDKYSDSTNTEYDPIKALHILAKADTVEAVNKSKDITKEYADQYMATERRLAEIATKTEAGETLTPSEQKEQKNLAVVAKYQKETFDKLLAQHTIIKQKSAAKIDKETIVEPINVTTDPMDKVIQNIVNSFGSTDDKNSVTNNDVGALLKRTDLTESDTNLLTNLRDANIVRTNINNRAISNKSITDVSNDIYNGLRGSEFKGIDVYKQGMVHYLNAGVNKLKEAKAELDGLKKFRDAHETKGQVFADLYKTIKAGQELTVSQQKAYADLKARNPNLYISEKSGKLVENIQQEVDALNKEVKLAESLYKAKTTKRDTTTSVLKQNASTALVESPTSTNPVVAHVVKPKGSGFTLTGKTPYTIKDQIKASVANAFIGFGVTNRASSTGQYHADAKRQGIPVNAEIKPTKDTIAFVSVSSEGKHNVDTIKHAVRVIEAGGMVVMDAQGTGNGQSHSKWNARGEGAVQDALAKIYGKPMTAKNGTSVFKKSTKQIITEQASTKTNNKQGDTSVSPAPVKPFTGKIALHEVAHIGMIRLAQDLGGMKELREILKGARQELMKAVPKLLKRTGHASLNELAMDYGYDMNTEEGKTKILVELTARWAEKFESMPAPSWWTELINSIKAWYTKYAGKLLTEKEVDTLVAELIRYGSTDNQNRNATAQEAKINESTEEDNTDIVPDNLAAYDNLGELEVNVGTNSQPIMVPYNEAIADLNKQLNEAEAILACSKG